MMLAFSLLSSEKEEQEREVTVKQVPRAVLQAFKQTYPSATVKEYAEETQKFYAVSFVFEGRKIYAVYKPDGAVSALEEVIPVEHNCLKLSIISNNLIIFFSCFLVSSRLRG